MNEITGFVFKVFQGINTYFSDYVLTILLLGIGIFYTAKTGVVQIWGFKSGLKQLFGAETHPNKEGVTPFRALMTSVAAQVGTGNIIGTCGAILAGGPGAIFWIWVVSFFGMATIYAEAILAQKTRVISKDGTVRGGPMYYIRKAFPNKSGKFLSLLFSASLITALGFMGSMIQSNAIAVSVSQVTKVEPWVTGIFIALISYCVFKGKGNRITAVAEKTVPVMATVYIILCVTVLLINAHRLPQAIGLIFKYAFQPQALIGGSLGAALKVTLSHGVKRGLFSNEAGMGTTPHAHAMAKVNDPHEQGATAMFGVFIDTFVILTLTALAVISTVYTEGGLLFGLTGESYIAATRGSAAIVTCTDLMQRSVGSTLGSMTFGNVSVAVCLTFFAFTSILGWNFFGLQNAEYLLGEKNVKYYISAVSCFIFLGSVFPNEFVWELADAFNGLMVIPNVSALFLLSRHVTGVKSPLKRKQ